MKNLFITGATGILGSHIVYQLLEDKLLNGQQLEIYLLVRPREDESPEDRVRALFCKSIMPQNLWSFDEAILFANLNIVRGSISDFSLPQPMGEDYTVIHAASSVNLGTSESAKQEIIQNNYEATKDFVAKIKDKTKKFIYISTAYSCGVKSGFILNDYLKHYVKDLVFRNHYEEYKFKTEKLLTEIARETGFSLTIARPSVICGRLI